MREVGVGNKHIGRCFLEGLNLLEVEYPDSRQSTLPVPGSSAAKDRSVFCILVVDGEGDKGQRTVTNGWASGEGSH